MSKPASPYLFDRLQARRANPTTRPRPSDSALPLTHLDDDLFMNEAKSCRDNSRATTPNHSHAPALPAASLGAREMEKRMDKLSKLNFDLKMELFHCKERMVKMQENCKTLASRAEKANRLVEDNAALLDLNDSLVKELERRDEAVQEAVTIICDLEERLERAQQSRQSISPDLSAPPRVVTLSPTPELSISSPTPERPLSTRPISAGSQRRIPSFIGDKKPSTRALRRVYLEPTSTLHAVKSYTSMVSQRDDGDKSISELDALDSPRLSVLSESSFQSIYDFPKSNYSDKLDETNGAPDDNQHDMRSHVTGSKRDSGSDIGSWIRVQTPQPPMRSSAPRQTQPLDSKLYQQDQQSEDAFFHQNHVRQASLGGSVFGGALLPPTPDSASTGALQDSYMPASADAKASHRVVRDFSNAAKHAALLHTPETPSIVDMSKLHISQHPRHSIPGSGWSNRHSASLSSTDEEDEYERPDSSAESRVGSAGSEGGYPTGGSIVTGTPSRFQVRHNMPPATNLLFDGEGIDRVSRPVGGRQNTLNAEAQLLQNNVIRHRMERSETTPNLATMQNPPVSARSFDARPRPMERSETTPNLVTLQPSPAAAPAPTPNAAFDLQRQLKLTTRSEHLPYATSKPQTHHNQGSGGTGVRATLSQKTHKLLRRMSDHHHHAASFDHAITAKQHHRGITLSPSKRPGSANSGGSSGDDSMAMQAANQAISSKNLGVVADVKSPSRGLFWRATGGSRR